MYHIAADFFSNLIAVVSYKIDTVLMDNGVHFTVAGEGRSAVKEAVAAGELFRSHREFIRFSA